MSLSSHCSGGSSLCPLLLLLLLLQPFQVDVESPS